MPAQAHCGELRSSSLEDTPHAACQVMEEQLQKSRRHRSGSEKRRDGVLELYKLNPHVLSPKLARRNFERDTNDARKTLSLSIATAGAISRLPPPFHITSASSSWSLLSNSYSLTPSPRALLTLLSSLPLSTSTTITAMAAYPPSSFIPSEERRSQEVPPSVAHARHHSGLFTHERLVGDPGGFIMSHDLPPRSSGRLQISRGETDSGVRAPTEESKEDEGEVAVFQMVDEESQKWIVERV